MPEWLDILLRSVGLFVFVLFLVRLIGKRQTANLTFFDLVTVIIIGVITAAIALNLVDLVSGLMVLVVWTALPVAIYILSLKFKTVRDIVQGKEAILINHGKILEDKLLEARLTPEDLLSQLRRKQVFQAADVEFAILEPNGELSVMLKKKNNRLLLKHLV